MNSNLVKGTAVGTLGGLLFGFDTAVITGTTQPLTAVFHLSAAQLSFTVSSALLGTVIGAAFAGIPGQKMGGRNALRVMAALYIALTLGCAFAPTWSMLVFVRSVGGLGIGGSSVLDPVYIAELSPPRLRGRLMGTFQVNIVVGVLLAYLSNALMALTGFGANLWRWELGVAAVPALLFRGTLFTIPQSSRWLVTQERIPEARAVLAALETPDCDQELDAIVASIQLERSSKSESLFARKYRLPIFLAVTIAAFNQLAGISAVLYYLNDISKAAGFTQQHAGGGDRSNEPAGDAHRNELDRSARPKNPASVWGRRHDVESGWRGADPAEACLRSISGVLAGLLHLPFLRFLRVPSSGCTSAKCSRTGCAQRDRALAAWCIGS